MSERIYGRFVLATFGSLGDLHPYIALSLELQKRGHSVVIAANSSHRPIVEAEGIDFHPVRPDVSDFGDETSVMKRVMSLRTGPQFLIRKMVMPRLRDSFADLNAICQGADVLVSHPLTLAAPLIAEQRKPQGLAWVSIAITPSVFLSAFDPQVLAPAPWLSRLRVFGPGFYAHLLAYIKNSTRSWVADWYKLRSELGLPATSANPLFDGQFSPQLVLAVFSELLAAPQPDWPPQTRVTGFPFYDRSGEAGELDPALEAFLNAGDPPIVFTLGSAAVMNAGDFYGQGAEAAQEIGRRALLLVGRDLANKPVLRSDDIAAFPYAPYSQVFPRAAAVVHQGGVGTTAQALRAGCPMVIVPFAFDQPDNAARAARLGVSRTIPRARYTAQRVASELQALLADERYATKAAEVGRRIQAEDGTKAACDALEGLLRSRA